MTHPFADFYRNRRVFVTGHTGFKGSWLCEWLLGLGAEVTGYSLSIPTEPALFGVLGHSRRLRDLRGDIRDLGALRAALTASRPEVLFHLAAQPIVRASYDDPIGTFSTNVLGTAHILEAARSEPNLRALVNVTSDKCYENQNWPFAYRESDPMGGADPYSASKGCAELVFSSYQRSFLASSTLRAASARAGNVIGGGDWAPDRLIPDSVRAWSSGRSVVLRNPRAVRPWQHVLEPLHGYLELGHFLGSPALAPLVTGQGFNLGPSPESFATVEEVVTAFGRSWPNARYELLPPAEANLEPHEAHTLKLACDKARAVLGLRSRLSLTEAVALCTEWYRAFYEQAADMGTLTVGQIRLYEQRCSEG